MTNYVSKKFIGLCFVLFLLCSINSCTVYGNITPCFTPNSNCNQQVVHEIKNENVSIQVQAYQLTAPDIIQALVDAKKRGVDVKIILDKTQYTKRKYSPARFFSHADIPVFIDYKPAIAHNKIMILGNSEVITGSYNFTNNAQKRNAENLLIIKDARLAKSYKENFNKRLSKSISLTDYAERKRNK